MTPSLALNLGLSSAALSAFCLSINRHHTVVLESKPGKRRVTVLRAIGWLSVALSLAAAGTMEGWAFGPVQWLGALTGAGVLLVLLLSYRPRSVGLAAAAALCVAVAGGILGLTGVGSG